MVSRPPTDDPPKFDEAVPPKIAARILGASAKALATWRVNGGGPPYFKGPGVRGLVRYPLSALYRWRDAHMQTSTSCAQAAPNKIDCAPIGTQDVDRIAADLANAITYGRPDERLACCRDGAVTVRINIAIPYTNQQVPPGRRKALRVALAKLLVPLGWKEVRQYTYHRIGASGGNEY